MVTMPERITNDGFVGEHPSLHELAAVHTAFTRAVTAHERGDVRRAMQLYDDVLRMQPYHLHALNNLGVTLLDLARTEEALADFEHALRIDPDFFDAVYNSGNALRALRRIDEALELFDHATKLRPQSVEVLVNRALTLRDLQRPVEAAEVFRRALQLQPDCLEALYGLGNAFGDLRHPPAAQLLASGRRYGHDKIRLAYLSADFHEHATAYLIAELLERHSRDRFELIGVSYGPQTPDAMRKRLLQAFNRCLDVRSLDDRKAAESLFRMGIDIAVDLKGHTNDARLGILSHRPAPIQVNYLGYPGTLGAEYIDYIIADRHTIPVDDQGHYREQVVYLPDSYQPNDTQRQIAVRTPTHAEVGLPPRGFVFCCFNNNYKITPPVFAAWMRLLNAVNGSVLWLLEGNAAAAHNLRAAAVSAGISEERLVFAGRVEADEHLARHRLADLFLDTIPVNAHTTASDALWAGLPVLTCRGDTFAGRVASSLLHPIGLPELVVDGLDEYESLALRLARNPADLMTLRAKLAGNRNSHPLFDIRRFTRHIEWAYRVMWERHERGEVPAGFSVPVLDEGPASQNG